MADTAQSGGNTGFFSSLVDNLSAGINKISSDVLPVWAANQLGIQQNNQLNQDTNNSALQAPTVGSIGQQTQSIITKSPLAAIALIGAGVLVVILILKTKHH